MGDVVQGGGAVDELRNAEAEPDRPAALERRHSFRVHLVGRASVWRSNQLVGHYRLHDLCLEGCALVGSASCKPGDRVELVLHIQDERPLWLSGTVRRSHGNQLAVRFDRLSARAEDRLQDLVVEAYARTHGDHQRFSLVVEPNPTTRRALVQSLDALGVRAVGVATPLDAVQLLLERGDRVENAFVGPVPRTGSASFELVEFLARHYPHTRRVLTGDARLLAGSWSAQAAGEVDALLETPCSDDALRRLVHRLEQLPHENAQMAEAITEA